MENIPDPLSPNRKITVMSLFVLIHGSGHGGWCWDKVSPLLKNAGHVVLAPDLPGSGNDHTPLSTISLESYVTCVCRILDAQDQPVILVGHSLGGITITQTAERRSNKIKALVYLAAFLLRNGERCLDIEDPDSLARKNMVFSGDGISKKLRSDSVKEVLYGDCADEDVARVLPLLVPEPLQIASTPMVISENNFGRVARYYIECLQDRAITPWCQRNMYRAQPCREVFSLRTSHSPFFSAPRSLVQHLLTVDHLVNEL